MTFKLKHDDEFEYIPPSTWEEVAKLHRPEKLKAVRHFVHQAAIRLHEDAGLHIDDLVTLFDHMPRWISCQRQAWKNEEHNKHAAWRCNHCRHIGTRDDFFAGPNGRQKIATCPSCKRTDAQQIFNTTVEPIL